MPRYATLILVSLALVHGGKPSISEDVAFPTQGILPKEGTGATRLLSRHPEYDGRGVVVAIFDTGVDPGAAGLQTTSDGRPKVVDLVDGSGSGDVRTSVVRDLAKDGTLLGLSGRRLKVPKNWQNPSKKYRVGIKRAFDLFPSSLVTRSKAERKRKWDIQQRKLLTRLERELIEWDAKHPKPNKDQKKERSELELRVELAQSAAKSYKDPGPILDCVVFHDGKHWRAAIDTDEDGDLGDEKAMTNYRVAREYSTIGRREAFNFAVNIYEDGDLLSIVADCGAHGTHVAGIVAGNYPEQPELNGIAPGAQIVSVKIGDSRLGSSSTGTGEVRGLIAAIRNKCDLINMSYGGATADPNRGRVIDLYSDIVNKQGIMFVVSAGNNGPALSTVGSPGGTTSALLGIGAYVTPAMMDVEYSLREQLKTMPYTWSSRGPTLDGDLGVDLCAPGGAIAPVPNWTLRPNMMMNGTSMSSPNACGAIALMLSGLKQQGVQYTPDSVRRALQNTARRVPGATAFATGAGSIQIDRALPYAVKHAKENGESLRYEVTLPGSTTSRGVHLRESFETKAPRNIAVRVQPKFDEREDPETQIAFQQRVQLRTNADWIDCPDWMVLTSGGDTISIRVDPTELPVGAHFATVNGYDASDPKRGPLFRVPVTVIKATDLSRDDGRSWTRSLKFTPGRISRNFLAVPRDATWADLKIRPRGIDNSRRLIVHTVQQLPRQSFRELNNRSYLTIKPDSETVHSFKVVGGQTLELCLAQYWSSLGNAQYDFQLDFHGIEPGDSQLTLDGSKLSGRVDVTSRLRREVIAPSAKLERLRQTLRPVKHELKPLSEERDGLPDGRQIYQLVLTYAFELAKPAEVTPMTALAYQDEASATFESGVWAIFDVNKQKLATGSWKKPTKLTKGKFTLKYHVRHDDPAALKKLEKMPLLLDRKLDKTVMLSAYTDPDDTMRGANKLSSMTLERGQSRTIFFAMPSSWPTGAKAGDRLVGTITYGKNANDLDGEQHRPGGFPLTVLVPGSTVAKSSSSSSSTSSTEKSVNELVESVKLARLRSLRLKKKREDFDKLAKQLLKKSPDSVDVLREQLFFLDDTADRKPHLPAIVELCDRIIDGIDQAELAQHFGLRLNSDDEAATKERAKMDKQKSILVDALYRKARAIAYMDLPEKYSPPGSKPAKQHPKDPAERDKLFEQAYAELAKWVDIKDAKYFLLYLRRERRLERPASALKVLNDHIRQAPPKKLFFKKRADIYDELGWPTWRDYERKWDVLRFPAAYPPF